MALASWLVMHARIGGKAGDSALINKVESNPRSHVMSVSGLHTLTPPMCTHTHVNAYTRGENETRRKTNNRRKLIQTGIPLFATSFGSILKLVAKAEEDAYSSSPASRSSG